MENQSNKYRLHSRVTIIFLVIAVVSTLVYLGATLAIVKKFEAVMLATMAGHELDELLVDLSNDPQAPLPKTASVNAYLLSRAEQKPIPEYLNNLEPNIYSDIRYGGRIYQVAIVDLGTDRLFIQFDITEVFRYQSMLIKLLIIGGLFSAVVLVLSGFWLSRKFLLPVSNLAEEVANINPTELNIHIEKNYQNYEVGVIARSIDDFLERMSDFVEREQSFAAAVSHELRTPVSVIATATDLLELKGINDNQKGAVSRIKDSTDYMAKVIESLLFFARNTHGAVEKTLPEVALHEIFPTILQQYQQQAADKNLSLELKIDSGVRTRMAESHLEIILGNLVRNALTNTTEGAVRVELREGGFSVTDTGYGIASHEIDLIVTRNYHSEDSMGCGLGLYLVKNICNIYGLKLEIESTVGEGSKFVVEFPDSIPIRENHNPG